MPSSSRQLKPRFRVMTDQACALGPGKADLLRLIAETGSISKAARQMNMSYMRAWTLVRTMNQCFSSDLILSVRGGKNGGGARLCPVGHKLLGRYTGLGEGS